MLKVYINIPTKNAESKNRKKITITDFKLQRPYGFRWSPDQWFLTICDNQNHEAYLGQAANENSKNKLVIVDYEWKRS